jgi:hypothetical protein
MYKGRGKYDDIDRERAWRLRKIKEEHKPIDYERLKQHEKSFLAEAMKNRERKKEELRKRIMDLEKSYKVSFKSQTHGKIKAGFSQQRNSVHLTRDHQQRNRDHSKQFAKKINEINFPKIDNLRATSNDARFPKQGHAHTQWFYGRFAIGEVRQNVDHTTAPNYNIKRNALGNDYLRYFQSISNKL